MTELLVAQTTRDAALFAVKHWHYSRRLPAGKLFIRGVWEDGRFVGAVVVSRGATHRLGSPWGLEQTECVELTRVALAEHETPVSRIVAIVLRDLKAANPGLRLVVSFSDPEHGHHGGIYQAGNWIYTGPRPIGPGEVIVNGTRMHMRSVHAKGWKQSLPWLREHIDPNATHVTPPEKHRYVMPLDRAMRRVVTREARAYPRRAGE